jgi:16S rRNA (guanine966-N2)-methyltransferase
MIRITSGLLKGRRLEVVGKGVRPTMESVREAIFSSLGGNCRGSRVLDLYAGSGSLGLEAWSRGASEVVFVEEDKQVAKQLKACICAFNDEALSEAKVYSAEAIHWMQGARGAFELILADPPYDMPNALEQTLSAVAMNSLLREGGKLVYESRASQQVEIPSGWNIEREKKYGKTKVLTLTQEKR